MIHMYVCMIHMYVCMIHVYVCMVCMIDMHVCNGPTRSTLTPRSVQAIHFMNGINLFAGSIGQALLSHIQNGPFVLRDSLCVEI